MKEAKVLSVLECSRMSMNNETQKADEFEESVNYNNRMNLC